MRSLLAAALALVTGAVSADIVVDGNVPAGNVIVEQVVGDLVKLRQDMRDSRNWFYWAFRVTGAEGRTVRFFFTDPYAGGPVSNRGPAVTRDGGKTWSYAAEGHCSPSNFVYSFAKDEREVWFYQTFQYYPRQWDEFLARHADARGKTFETGVLCKSRKGRDVPKAVFGRIDGQARYRVCLSSRTHCGEAPATYVVEGWLERVFGNDALGAWLRENVEFMVVPFVDYDGVVDGDQGKGRRPHDHNRDYHAFLYPESKAIAEWIARRAKGKIDVAFDCHSPWVRGVHNEKVYQTHHADEWNNAAKIRWGRLVEKSGSMNYTVTGDFPWKFGWNGPSNTAPDTKGGQPLLGLGGWIGRNCTNLLVNSTYEIPFANAAGTTVTPESCRGFGSASAEALKAFLETMRPSEREGVVYRDDFDRFGNYTECFNAGASLMEEKNGVLALVFAPKAASDFRTGWFKIDTPPKTKTWKVDFNYAFATDDSRAFALKLAFGDRANPDVRTLFVDECGSHFGYARTARPKDGTGGFLPKGSHNWNKGSVVVTDGRAAFWTYRSGRLVKECETAFPDLPLVGWNFGIAAEKGGEVRLDRVVVTEGCSRPYDRGDPTEWLGESPVATRFQWDECWGRPVTGKEPLAVDFTKESAELHVRFPVEVSPFTVNFNSATGTTARLTLGTDNVDFTLSTREAGGGVFTNATRKIRLPAERFRVSGTGAMDREYVYARPSLRNRHRYQMREINEIWASYDRLRTLKDQVWAVAAKRIGPTRYRVFLNENVISEFDSPSPVVSVGVASKTAEVRGWAPPDEQAGADAQTYELPFAPGGFALERVRENQGTYALECNGYLSRNAFDAMPSSCLFNVPKRQWTRAKAVCRIDPAAPTNAVPVITARLTQFYANGGRSMAMCEKTVDLRDPNAPVVKRGDDYEVTFDLDIGSLQDLVFMDDGMARKPLAYLHFEFTGPVWEKARYYMDPGRLPAESEVSSLQVFSGTLEASPADFKAIANRNFSLYYPDETPGATITVNPRVADTYRVEAVVSDETGKMVERKAWTFPQLERPMTLQVDFGSDGFVGTQPYGWYEVVYTLRDKDEKPIVRHEASFVRLRPDTREAGLDSPYYSWNFRGAHGTPWRFEDWADMYVRLGIHRTTLLGKFTGGTNKGLSETSPECVKWNMTQVQFPYVRGGYKDEAGRTNYVAKLREMVDQFPHSRTALVFHESGFGPFPKEVYGGVTEVDDAVREADAKKVEAAKQCAEAWREVDPTVKLIHGNSSGTIGLVARLMRGGYPKELMDAMGEESVGMAEPPELSTALLPWQMKKLARFYGYTEAMDCPREWKSRYYPYRHAKDKTPAAGLLLRDALIAHALGYTVIPVGASTETGNSYADSIWCSGTYSRWPLAYPRKAAAGVAYLTQVLDRAKFVRLVPTGSLTVHALEFDAPGGYVYALWDSRGETAVSVAWAPFWGIFPKTGEGEVVSFTGRVVAPRKDGKIAIGEEPAYLVTDDRVESFAADRGRTFPRERFAGMGKAKTVQRIASADEIDLAMVQDRRVEVPFAHDPKRVGSFAMKTVKDDEKGSCVELRHLSKAACPEMVVEYVTLRFKDPKPVDGVCTNLGVWVKGNSNWGQIHLEFVDAEGERWFSAGCGGVGCYTYDWPRKMATNYDGWNFLQLPLLHGSPVRIPAPGDDEWQWTRDGQGNGKIDFPIRVTAVVVGQMGRTLDLLEMKEGGDTVRIGPVQVW